MCAPGKSSLPANTIEFVALPDGRIRYQTGSFAGAGHVSAAAFEQALLKELGVTPETRESNALAHHHHHEHDVLKVR